MATQWAPGSLHSKEVLFGIVHSVGMSEYEHYTAQAQESLLNLALEQQIRQFSFEEGRGLAPVVQTMDSAVHRLNHYPADKH